MIWAQTSEYNNIYIVFLCTLNPLLFEANNNMSEYTGLLYEDSDEIEKVLA